MKIIFSSNYCSEDCHHRIQGNAERHTLSDVRKEYWKPRGICFDKQILFHCIIRGSLTSRPYNLPKSPALPLSRDDDSYSFVCTGLDCKNLLVVEIFVMKTY